MTDVLRVSDLAGGYGSLTVFRGLELTLRPAQTLGLFGPNGAGKSTLLSTIVGLVPALAGSVVLDGENVTSLKAYERARRRLALVPEGRQVLGSLSVVDNLRLTRACDKAETAVAFERRLDDVFDLLPRLRERATQSSGSLSGGEQQMLAIGRALLVRPKVLMLDEPTQGLAPVIVKELATAFRSLKGRFAMLVVEQNRDFLELVSDRLLMMTGGEIKSTF